jgi:hypothetical protein
MGRDSRSPAARSCGGWACCRWSALDPCAGGEAARTAGWIRSLRTTEPRRRTLRLGQRSGGRSERLKPVGGAHRMRTAGIPGGCCTNAALQEYRTRDATQIATWALRSRVAAGSSRRSGPRHRTLVRSSLRPPGSAKTTTGGRAGRLAAPHARPGCRRQGEVGGAGPNAAVWPLAARASRTTGRPTCATSWNANAGHRRSPRAHTPVAPAPPPTPRAGQDHLSSTVEPDSSALRGAEPRGRPYRRAPDALRYALFSCEDRQRIDGRSESAARRGVELTGGSDGICRIPVVQPT